MKHKQLKAFHAVALESSFSRAAERLCLTQPALTVQVRNLERDYGVRLFERLAHSVSLTRQGKELFALTQQLFAIETDIRDSLNSHACQLSGELRIGVDNPYAALPLVDRYRNSFPGVRVELVPGNGRQVMQSLLEEQVDMAVVTHAQEDPRLIRLALQKTRLLALTTADSPWASKRQIAPSDLLREPLICREATSNTHRLLHQALAEQQSEFSGAVAQSLRVGSRELMKEAVVAGLGIGFVMSGEVGEDSRLHSLEIEGIAECRTDYLLYRISDRHRKVISGVLEVL